METLLAATLLSLSTNLDNLAVGFAYGLQRLTIGWVANGAIALLSGISTLIAMTLGQEMATVLTPQLAHQWGSFILIGAGAIALGKHYFTAETDTTRPQGAMSLRDALMLGLALTFSNLGTGIGAGMAALDLGMTSILSLVSSLALMAGGVWVGRLLNHQLRNLPLMTLAGVVLMGLGFYEYFT